MNKKLFCIFVFLAVLMICASACSSGGSDKAQVGDDDATPGDDDTFFPDDDASPDDDDATPPDDDTNPDDDTTPVDDDTNPDDDTTPCEGCLIGVDCFDDGETNPENVCLICDVGQSATAWSYNDTVTCEDDQFCNGADTCLSGECSQHAGDPCADDGLWCNGAESCDEGNDQCIHEYTEESPRCPDDGLWCTGAESCDEDNDQCLHQYTEEDPRCPDDGFWCNGTESCNDTIDSCVHSQQAGDPCPDDGLWCNGAESCDEDNDQCLHQYTEETPRCPDDGLFCTGTESCNDTLNQCEHSGDTCDENEVCNDTTDLCDLKCYEDLDADAFGNPEEFEGVTTPDCPDGWTTVSGDCNDNDPDINPNGIELPGDGIDQDCNDVDLTPSNATGVFVSIIGDDGNSGAMDAPKLTIGAAVTAAEAAGKVVFIAEGTYEESVVTTVSLFGGYEATNWTRDIENHVTSIIASGVSATKAATRAIGVLTPDEAALALQGLVINGGDQQGDVSYGVMVNPYSRVVFDQNVIEGGLGNLFSYAISIDRQTYIQMYHNLINGGAGPSFSICLTTPHGEATIYAEDNFFDGGTAPAYAVGLDITTDSSVTLVNNLIFGGTVSNASSISVGLQLRDCAVVMVNNNIDGGGNVSSGESYGIWIRQILSTVDLKILDNIIDGGLADISRGLYIEGAEQISITLLNNDIWGSAQDCLVYYESPTTECLTTDTAVNGCAWTGCSDAAENLSQYPEYVDPENGDLHLQSDSPCIDAGVDPWIALGLDLADYDFDGNLRPSGEGWDIGAFEYQVK